MRGNSNHLEEEQQQHNLDLHLDERRKRIQCPVDFGEAWRKTKKMKKNAENNEEDEDETQEFSTKN